MFFSIYVILSANYWKRVLPMSFEIRKAVPQDAEALKALYFEHLTQYPPSEPQDLSRWRKKIAAFEKNPDHHLLVLTVDGVPVSSVTLIIIENLTHNMRPYAIIENVVTHTEHRGNHYATALIRHAREIAKARGCYKIMLMTGSKKESTLRFYKNCGFDQNAKTAFLMKL